jgi:DNA-binding response OmpR family regulator
MPKSARVSVIRTDNKPVVWGRSPRVRTPHSVISRPVPQRPTLLWIDDFETGLEMYRAMFEARGFRVLTASSGEAGIALAAANHVDLVVTDYEMPGMNGEAVAVALKSLKPQVPVILYTGSTEFSDRARVVVDACCDKAASREELLATVHFLLQKKRPAFLQPPPVTRASDHGQRTVA